MILAKFFAKAMQEFSGWRKDWVQEILAVTELSRCFGAFS